MLRRALVASTSCLALLLAIGWGAALPLLVPGCGYEESYTGLGDQAMPGDPLRPLPPQCCCQGGGGGGGNGRLDVDDLGGSTYRFTSLVLSKPTALLNGYFAEAIGGNAPTVHVLLAIDEDDREAKTLASRIGAGEAVEGGYRLTGSSPLGLQLEEARFDTIAEAFLEFPNAMLVPPALPLHRLELAGLFSPAGDAIVEGELHGLLLLEEARQVKLGEQTLEQVLGLLVAPDHRDEDGEPDGWTFVATFGAAQVVLVEDE